MVGDWQIVRNAWVDPQSGDTIEALRREVRDEGGDFDEAFMDFAARNVTWDYEHGDWYAYYFDYYADGYPSYDESIVGEIDADGTGGWESPPSSQRPHRYGANVWHMDGPDEGSLLLSFEGDPEGSRGEPADWGLTVVMERGSTVQYEEISLSGGSAEVDLGDLSDWRDVYFVVGAWSDDLDFRETFDYQLSVEIEGTGGTDGGGTDGGGTDGGDDSGSSDGGGSDDTGTDGGGDPDRTFGDTVADEDLVSAGGCSSVNGVLGFGWVLGLGALLGLRRRE